MYFYLYIYIKLFNHILDTGNIPGNLTIGEIIPIYKNKGERNLPENYLWEIFYSTY